MSSLQSGHGPSGIGPLSCSAGGSGSAYCSTQAGTAALAPGVGGWTPLYPSLHVFASMAYDSVDGYVILFGGVDNSGAAIGDSWKFLGGSWTDITPSSSPSPRFSASMAYDTADGYVVLFGGLGASGSLGDTWK